MIGTGIAASAAQIFLTKAYQNAPAAIVTAISYSAPVMSLGLSILFFGEILSTRSFIGCMVILCFGIFLPFLRGKSLEPETA